MADADAPPQKTGATTKRRVRAPLIALLLIGAAVIGVIWLLGGQGASTRAGALITNDPDGNDGNGVTSRRVGASICYGYVQILNPGAKVATMKAVEIHGAAGFTTGPLTVLGADRDEFLYPTAETCPAGGAPAKGFRIPPDDSAARPNYGVELLIPLTLAQPGEHRITGVTVTYEYDGRTYKVDQQSDLQMCTTACEIKHL
jgi:hypothetical protein